MLPSCRYDHDLDLDAVVLILKPGRRDSFRYFGPRAIVLLPVWPPRCLSAYARLRATCVHLCVPSI